MSNPTEALMSIEVVHGGGLNPTSIATEYARESTSPKIEAEALSRMFAAIASGVRPAKVRVRVESMGSYAARRTFALTQANIAAGETISFRLSDGRIFTLTAVASGASYGSGTFNSATSDTVTAASAASAINSLAGLRDFVSATSNAGDLIVQAVEPGTAGNNITVIDGTVNGLNPAGGALQSGVNPSVGVTSTAALVFANIVQDDTITIAGVVFTWRNSASGESQVTIGANATAAGDNLAAKVNAHSKLLGLVTAANAAGTVTFTYHVSPRIAVLLLLATSDGDSATLTQPATNLTLASTQATRTYDLGAP